MSHYRNLGGGRRDKNEPEIMQRFRHHGWHPEQVSGNRQWDLNAYPPDQPSERVTGAATLVFHVDVKGPNGKVEDAQREKWTALSERGIPVYVVRTEADVDALVCGDLQPWAPWENEVRGMAREAKRGQRAGATGSIRAPRHHGNVKRERKGAIIGTPPFAVRLEVSGHTPPVDAAKEAAETFTPSFRIAQMCSAIGCREFGAYGTGQCPKHTPKAAEATFAPAPDNECAMGSCHERVAYGSDFCAEHTP